MTRRSSACSSWGSSGKSIGFLVGCVILVGMSAHAQRVSLSPSDVDAAIRAGDITKQYRLVTDSKRRPFALGYLSTPFSRIALVAEHYRRQFLPFTAASVPPELLAPEAWLYVFPDNAIGIRPGPDVREPKTVVITPRKAGGDVTAHHPLRTMPFSEVYRAMFRAKFDGQGLIAMFPLELLNDANEIRIVYDDGWNCDQAGLTYCRVDIRANIR